MQPMTTPSPSGNILHNASNVVITGGSFVGVQNNTMFISDDVPIKAYYKYRHLWPTPAPNAILNGGGRADDVKCFPGTREEVMAKIKAWMTTAKRADESGLPHRIFWLSGPAGAGKSAIIQTLAESCISEGLPVATFFFFRGDRTRNKVSPVVATLLTQLFRSYPGLEPLVLEELVKQSSPQHQTLSDQFERLLVRPMRGFRRLPENRDRYQWPTVILIDGLDECLSNGTGDQRRLLRLLHGLMSSEDSPFIVLVASRPEPHLRMIFSEIGTSEASIFLDETYRPSDDIRLFVTAELARIKKTHHLGATADENWPAENDINAIVSNSSGQFIFAATVIRFIANSPASPVYSLEKVLGLRPVKKGNPFAELDAVYTYILAQTEDWDSARDILAAQMIFTKYSIGGDNASRLQVDAYSTPERLNAFLGPMGYTVNDVASYLSDLTSIVQVDTELDQLKFYHASLNDFLCDNSRSGDYYIDFEFFKEKMAIVHINGIHDLSSWVTCSFILGNLMLEPSVPSLPTAEAFVASPPSFDVSTTIAKSFVLWFLEGLSRWYHPLDVRLYTLIIRQWLIWARNIGFDLEDGDFARIELGKAVWTEIITGKASIEPQTKKAPLWRRILRRT